MLGEFEQIVMLSIMQVGDDAYGVTVRREIQRRTARDFTLGSLYKTLARLEDKGLVMSRVGEPTATRGGRRKRCYAVTATGQRALRQSVAAIREMARGLDVGLESP
jgi:PadR family transcriptional regulator PadR